MIYTQYGVKVRIIAVRARDVIVQGVDEPEWVRTRKVHELRADGGWDEINAAVEAAPYLETPEVTVEPVIQTRPRNPLTGHYLGGDRGGR